MSSYISNRRGNKNILTLRVPIDDPGVVSESRYRSTKAPRQRCAGHRTEEIIS